MSIASIVLDGVSFSFGPKSVLVNTSFSVGAHTKMGVVGPNGTGKSTLLRLIAGELQPDTGAITRMPPDAAVGYLAQEPLPAAGETVDGYLRRRTGVATAEAELERSATALASGSKADSERYEAALNRFNDSGAADFDIRMPQVLADNRLPDSLADQPMVNLSGGQQARVALSAILLSRFDLLLLDEPTNDLDFESLDRLEQFVNDAAQGIVVVSHDRAFLERTTTSILELDAHNHAAKEFNGGWLAYQQERSVARALAEERYSHYASAKEDLLAGARRQRSWSDKGVAARKNNRKDNDKFQVNFFNDKTEKQAGKAKQTEKAIERLEQVDKPFEGWTFHMSLGTAERAGDMVADLNEAIVSRSNFELGPVTLNVGWGERIAIVGPNGAGKSTLLQTLLGEIPLTAGSHRLGKSVIVGELDQLRRATSTTAPLIDTFLDSAGVLQKEARSLLAKFGLTADHVARSGESLSPGERTRAMLALLMAQKTNVLVLDEPTNHLDIEAIEQLEQALDTYDGTVLMITHDRKMLESIRLTRVIEVDSGRITSDSHR